MGTPGFIIFRFSKHCVKHYVHMDGDSLIDYVLRDFRHLLTVYSITEIDLLFKQLRIIPDDENIVPTMDEILMYQPFYEELSFPPNPVISWRELLHKCQGDLLRILQSGCLLDTADTDVSHYTFHEVVIDFVNMTITENKDDRGIIDEYNMKQLCGELPKKYQVPFIYEGSGLLTRVPAKDDRFQLLKILVSKVSKNKE